MRKRLLVTAGGGFVAGSVVRQAGDSWELHPDPAMFRSTTREHVLRSSHRCAGLTVDLNWSFKRGKVSSHERPGDQV